MSILSDFRGSWRFASGLRAYVQKPLSLEASRQIVLEGMQRRETALLNRLERAVFSNTTSPYLRLFHYAGCEMEDVRKLVQQEGVESALSQLRDAGIYVTFDEFKGRKPIVRGSQTLTVSQADFDNKLIKPHFHSTSGGSSGTPSRILIDLDHLTQSAPHWHLWFAENGWLNRPLVFWTPAHSGVACRHLICVRFGKPFVKWFYTVGMVSTKDRLAAACVHGLVRHFAKLPRREYLPVDRAEQISMHLVQMVRGGHKPLVVTSPSEAIRVCLAAGDRGFELNGVAFLLGAEPLTEARRRTIEQSGAEAVPTYGFSEGGCVGSQCSRAAIADDIHICLDAYAVIQRPRSIADDETVDALLLTALRPACPKILLNTEIGDYAVLGHRRCGCLFDEFGYHQHLHTIRSFDKLTGVGMTFVGADLFGLLEEVMPQRFGGAATDYQLVEQQDAQGQPRYTLRVSPEIGALDEQQLIKTFLAELDKRRGVYRFMTKVWRQADILRVQRERPLTTSRGKVLPFRTLGV